MVYKYKNVKLTRYCYFLLFEDNKILKCLLVVKLCKIKVLKLYLICLVSLVSLVYLVKEFVVRKINKLIENIKL